ncbi:hypothetical protein [Fischerella sp. PCC 9605]|jgi:hypothetical protein|uniref:hypothetical protein n=1 Tax=Fischerella sp. PCC 9605 TaxID=1173024 RepID=UPI0004796D67|nr:hypothetical protein [Fischerella sp. PCC 9605]
MNTSILDKVIEQLKVMPEDLQSQVLEFARTLAGTKIQGVPGCQLIRFAGVIPPDDIQLIREAIEKDCEQIDINEW